MITRRPPEKSVWGPLLLLLTPLLAAILFSWWWLKRTPEAPAKPAAVETPGPLASLIQSAKEAFSRRSVNATSAPARNSAARSASLRPSYTLDLESGVAGESPAADLWWHFETRARRTLDGRHGALLSVVEGRAWEQLDAAALAGIRYSRASLLAWGIDDVVRPGTLIAVRTAEGNFAKVRIVDVKPGTTDLQIEWEVFPVPRAASKGDGGGWERKLDLAREAYRDKRPDDAEKLYAEALAGAESFGPANPRVALALQRAAGMYWSMQRLPEAEQRLVRAASILKGLPSETVAGELGTANERLALDVLWLLAIVQRDQQRYEDASESFRATADLARSAKVAPQDQAFNSLRIASSLYEHAMAECRLKRNDSASRALVTARSVAPDTPSTQHVIKSIDRLEANMASGRSCWN